jgi:homoaconitate hydratase family protein
MGMTVVEKILARASGKAVVKPAEGLRFSVDLAMSHENASGAIPQHAEIHRLAGATPKLWDPSKVAIIFDHRVPAPNVDTANNQKMIRDFVAVQGISKFHDIDGNRGGICHQVLPENGYVLPGMVVVGTDSHTTTHGAMGAFAFGTGVTEMSTIWTFGKVLFMEVPATIKVVVNGQFRPGVSAKDLILHVIGVLTADGATNRVIEFHGDTIKAMPMNGRLTLCNMAVEAGATSGIIPADDTTEKYLRSVAGCTGEIPRVLPDADAVYEREVHIDASQVDFQIACPHTVDNVKNISEVLDTPVHQVVLGSCTNGRLEDIATAATIMKGKVMPAGVRMLVFPASWRVWGEANRLGYLETLRAAGAIIMNPGCGCCVGAHQGILAEGETALSTTNRNFVGRMGSGAKAFIYLCAPAVAAASALTGRITRPEGGQV